MRTGPYVSGHGRIRVGKVGWSNRSEGIEWSKMVTPLLTVSDWTQTMCKCCINSGSNPCLTQYSLHGSQNRGRNAGFFSQVTSSMGYPCHLTKNSRPRLADNFRCLNTVFTSYSSGSPTASSASWCRYSNCVGFPKQSFTFCFSCDSWTARSRLPDNLTT